MKIPVSVWALFLMLIAGCTNLHEQHLEIYENAVANVNSDTTLQSVTFNLLDAETAFLRDFSCEVYGEPEGIIELERIVARYLGLSVCLSLLDY